jgi:hypothetical protein
MRVARSERNEKVRELVTVDEKFEPEIPVAQTAE